MNQIEHGCSDSRRATDAQPENHVTDLRNNVKRKYSFHILLRNCADDSDCHCGDTHDHHQVTKFARKQQSLYTNEAIHADFGQ